MKNTILLLVFFLVNGVMFNNYFVPNINKENNTDQIERVLLKVKKVVPATSKVYFLIQGNVQDNPEIYYKAQFSLAPRVVIAEKLENVPPSNYMLLLQDKNITNEAVLEYPIQDYLFIDGNEFFEATLLKKNL